MTQVQLKFKDVIAGCDFGTTNPSVILVAGIDFDNRVYIIDEFYETNVIMPEFVNMAKQMQEKYKISNFFVDPSGSQWIMAMRNAGLRVTEGNNDVVGGIAWMSTFFEIQPDGKPKIFILKKCRNFIMELENYRYKDKKLGKEEDQHPMKIYDHACFIAGTKVMTVEGDKNIEDMKAGDRVLTRKGFRNVIASGCTKKRADIYCAIFSDGHVLYGTADHPIFVQGKGFVRMDALRYAFKVSLAKDNPWLLKKSYTMESNLGDIRKVKTTAIGTITGHMQGILNNVCEQSRILNVSKDRRNVLIAEESSKSSHQIISQDSVQTTVSQNGDVLKDLIMKKDAVLGVAPTLLSTNTAKRKPVHVLALEKCPFKADVYNLTVEEDHEYYANGILVSNCDSARYLLQSLFVPKPFVGIRGVRR